MDTVFYKTFERHAHGEGLKAHATHYCPGCGHGLVHKFLAEAIQHLEIQDRTVAISPVGCSVFLYYYLDVGNTQAAHGRAPAVAVGQKMANPDSIVVCYQGDGDLASIGLAEIIHTAQMGLPLTVIFVNNAIYGMTGGQMAPTTLMDQRTTTTPKGRSRFTGEPLRIAEMIAGLDGPIYVERVALFNNKQRFRARKAIEKALTLQVENRGFSLVEVLAECPTHLRLTPEDAQRWVEENMVPVFPLGVKKDLTPDPWPAFPAPSFDTDLLLAQLGCSNKAVPRHARSFPTHLDSDDVALKFAGSGGDGAQTIAKFTCLVGINEGYDATYIPSYGPESRGGTSYADVHVAATEVLSPTASEPHVLTAFNAPSLSRFAPQVAQGGIVLYDSTVCITPPQLNGRRRTLGLPFTQIATELGKPLVKNVVALGALQAATELFPAESFVETMRHALHGNQKLLLVNEEAFARGARAAEEASDA